MMFFNKPNHHTPLRAQPVPARQQQGNVLLLSLVLLGVVSLLGLSSMRGALVEEGISINIQDQHLATESAESALRAGERKVKHSSHAGHVGYYSFQLGSMPDIFSWDNSNSYVIPDAVWGANNPQPAPRFKIELFRAPDVSETVGDGVTVAEKLGTSSRFYRVVGYGQGRSDNSVALEESIVIYE